MVKKVFEKEVYKGRRLTITEDRYVEDNICYERELVHVKPAVLIIAITDKRKILFVTQYRQAINHSIIDLPAGIIDENEAPMDAALRELEEETGYRANKIKLKKRIYPSCGYSDEVIYIYQATELKKTAQHLDIDEFITVSELSFDEARKLVNENKIETAVANVALMDFFLNGEAEYNKEIFDKKVEEVKDGVTKTAKVIKKSVEKNAVEISAKVSKSVKETVTDIKQVTDAIGKRFEEIFKDSVKKEEEIKKEDGDYKKEKEQNINKKDINISKIINDIKDDVEKSKVKGKEIENKEVEKKEKETKTKEAVKKAPAKKAAAKQTAKKAEVKKSEAKTEKKKAEVKKKVEKKTEAKKEEKKVAEKKKKTTTTKKATKKTKASEDKKDAKKKEVKKVSTKKAKKDK